VKNGLNPFHEVLCISKSEDLLRLQLEFLSYKNKELIQQNESFYYEIFIVRMNQELYDCRELLFCWDLMLKTRDESCHLKDHVLKISLVSLLTPTTAA
jgi:tRNA A22 N-methylase